MFTVPDFVIAGCGFAGAAAARSLAENGNTVLIIERRPHIGGNMFDENDENGVLIHRYGPHIFHTNNQQVFSFLNRFSRFVPYEHRVLGYIDGKYVPIRFNFKSLETLAGAEKAAQIEKKLLNAFPGRGSAAVTELLDSPDNTVREFGAFVFEKVFVHYTAKQWGTSAANVDKSVFARVPVIFGYDDRYFSDTYQFMPAEGFTKLFEKMLDHKNIRVELNVDIKSRLTLDLEKQKLVFDGAPFEKELIFTGAADELLDFSFGALPYRSLRLEFERLPVESFQPAAVVNYPNTEEFTRITEFKRLTGQKLPGATTILREYPQKYDIASQTAAEPFYPINNTANDALYRRYAESIAGFKNVHLCGRLAEYRYYNMDAAVLRGLELAAILTR